MMAVAKLMQKSAAGLQIHFNYCKTIRLLYFINFIITLVYF